MDYALYGSADALTISNKMVTWIKQKTGGNPMSIIDGYKLNGSNTGSGTEAVFIAPFVAASVTSTGNQAFLNSGWTYLKTAKSGYYSDSYSLLCQLFISGNWWKPEAGTTTPVCVPATASSDDGNVAANVLDNDMNTRWSASGDGQWIQLCLANSVSVTGVDIAFYNGNTRRGKFDIQLSTNGSSWTNAATNLQSSGTSTALETFNITPATAKYVRILGHGNNVNAWNSYTEVKVRTAAAGARIGTAAIVKEEIDEAPVKVYPNPVAQTATITFRVKEAGLTNLGVYDASGKRVALLINEQLAAGAHKRVLNAGNMPAGIYILRLVHDGKVTTSKLVKE